MRTQIKTAVAIAALATLLTAGAAALAQQSSYAPVPPAPLEKGWNLISVPCDIALSDFRQGYGNKDLKAYGWDGAAFAEVDALKRGRGYFINANQVLNPSSICKPSAANISTSVTLTPGWNLIGNPYHRAAAFKQLFGGIAEGNELAIYEVKKEKVKELSLTDNAKPWEGYWVYTSTGIDMPVVEMCEVNLYARRSADGPGITSPAYTGIGHSIYFHASASASEGPSYSWYLEDVTASATWHVSAAGGVITVSGGAAVFTPAASGTADVGASYCGATSSVFSVVSIDSEIRRELVVTAYADEDYSKKLETASAPAGGNVYFKAMVGTYAGETLLDSKDVTLEADWSSDNVTAGKVDGAGKFSALASGTATVTAEYDGLTAPGVAVKVESVCDSLLLVRRKGMQNDVEILNSFDFISGKKEKECEIATWRVSSDKQYPVRLSCLDISGVPYGKVLLNGGKTTLSAYCASKADNNNAYYINAADVTDSVKWESLDESLVAADGATGVFKGIKPGGVTGVKATYGDGQSGIYWFRVVDKRKLGTSLNLHMSGPYSAPDYYPGTYFMRPNTSAKAYATAFTKYSYTDGASSLINTVRDDSAILKSSLTSSAPGVVSVDGNENVSSKTMGHATLTAVYDGASSSINVVVADNFLASLSFEPANSIIVVPGATAPVKIVAKYIYMLADNEVCPYEKKAGWGQPCQQNVDVTNSAQISLADAFLGTFSRGVFKSAGQTGSTDVTATFDGLTASNRIIVKKYEWMHITVRGSNAIQEYYRILSPFGYFIEKGKKDVFKAYGTEVDGMFEGDLSADATWEVSDSSIASFGPGGELQGHKTGLVWVRATVGEARSDKAWVAIVEDGFEFVLVTSYDDSAFNGQNYNAPILAGSSRYLYALHFVYSPYNGGDYWMPFQPGYDIFVPFFKGDFVENSSTWSSSDNKVAYVPTVDNDTGSKGYLTAVGPGFADVTPSYKNLPASTLTVEVWDNKEMTYCDEGDINSAEWSHEYETVTLEANCRVYQPGDPVEIRYSIDSDQVLAYANDVCLDLYVLDDAGNTVRTLRDEGCSTEARTKSFPPIGRIYQAFETWDKKDDAGKAVPPGKYYVSARFFFMVDRYVDPVIRVPITIVAQ